MRRYARCAFCALFLAFLPASTHAAPAPPPGFNVHLAVETPAGVFWRGGAPRRDTLAALAASARARRVSVTLLDLRHPPMLDDRSGRQGRLSPEAEAAAARELGLSYFSISALDRQLPARIEQALRRGDVYMHCMYGVNRTGFATARFARVTGEALSHSGLGARDWRQGDAFQARLNQHRGAVRPAAKAPRPPAALAAHPAPDPAAVNAVCAAAAWATWAAVLPHAR